MKKYVKLSTKITLLVSMLIIILLLTSTIITSRRLIGEIQTRIENNCMNIAKTISHDKFIIENLSKKDPDGLIQPYITTIIEDMPEYVWIVVTDMDTIRYSHPIEERVGLKGVGEDVKDVLEHGKSYISIDMGSMGETVRAFTPVYDGDQQIGFIVTAILAEDLYRIRTENSRIAMYVAFIGILLGIGGAVFLSLNIRKSIRGLEPYEIARLYDEKESVLNTVEEGIVAIDSDSRITMINNAAISILSLNIDSDESLQGKYIKDVFPENKLERILQTRKAEHNRQDITGNAVIVTNRIPIMKDSKVTGALATFSDRTKVVKLAEEITGIKQISDGLRANNHEFMNKLHVILGLVHKEKYVELKEYVTKISDSQNVLTKNIYDRIDNSQVEALLIGKFSRAGELGIEMKLFEDSHLSDSSVLYNSYLIAIIGNLLENAFDAILKNKSSDEKIVRIGIIEQDDEIEIIVDDTGIGIDESEIPKIFDRGYSTKKRKSGTGLYLVREYVDALDGEINVNSVPFKKTQFHIVIRKVIDND